jgi:hypothetical protein
MSVPDREADENVISTGEMSSKSDNNKGLRKKFEERAALCNPLPI